MSRAFVKDTDSDREVLPERSVSTHPNFVTQRGLGQIEEQLQRLGAERTAARAGGDTDSQARIERDLRYWTARRVSARLVPPARDLERVRFGMRVTLRVADGATHAFRLVGEDEADAAQGLVSYVAPLAQSLLGRRAGEQVAFQGGEAEIESIEP
jgi:transcription elongation GreA/GreB family factor